MIKLLASVVAVDEIEIGYISYASTTVGHLDAIFGVEEQK